MSTVEHFFIVALFVQYLHSGEELLTGFHKKWYLFKMPFKTFLAFEICFLLFWTAVLFVPQFPYRYELQAFFLLLMFANGVQHIVWSGSTKTYVPGLITACVHIAVFMAFYFQLAIL